MDTSRLGEIREALVLERSQKAESHNAETDDAEGGQYYPHGDSSCESEENHDERECAAAGVGGVSFPADRKRQCGPARAGAGSSWRPPSSPGPAPGGSAGTVWSPSG